MSTRSALLFTVMALLVLAAFGFSSSAMAIEPDQYEDDDSPALARVITMNSGKEPQRHNFHDAADADWVKFYGVTKRPAIAYKIELKNIGVNAQAGIELYDSDGTTLLLENKDEGETLVLTFDCRKQGVYYIKIANHSPELFGEGTEYELSISFPTGPIAGTGVISGMITDVATGAVIDGALIKTSGSISDISSKGFYLMLHPAGFFTVSVTATGYPTRVVSCTVTSGENLTQDFALGIGGSDNGSICLAESLYGEHAAATRLLRSYRDRVLAKTIAGRAVIGIYNAISRRLTPVMTDSPRLREALRESLDSLLPLIQRQLE